MFTTQIPDKDLHTKDLADKLERFQNEILSPAASKFLSKQQKDDLLVAFSTCRWLVGEKALGDKASFIAGKQNKEKILEEEKEIHPGHGMWKIEFAQFKKVSKKETRKKAILRAIPAEFYYALQQAKAEGET